MKENENKIKQNWIILLILTQIFMPICYFAMEVSYLASTIQSNELLYEAIGRAMAPYIMFMISVYFLYRSAYKKAKTTFLVFAMIIVTFLTVTKISIAIFEPIYPAFRLLMVVDIVLSIWFLRLSLKLRRINSIAQFKNLNQNYKDMLCRLIESNNLDELNHRYHEIITDWPKYEKFSTDQYKYRKKALT